MRKQLLSTLLALCMALLLLPGTARATETSGSFKSGARWSYSNGTLTIQGTGSMDDYANITRRPWHDYREQIHTVYIGNGVTNISHVAFYDCGNLTSVTIPDSVTIIEHLAFAKCSSLTSVTIPDSVTIIEHSTFEFCKGLTSVVIPNSVTTIGTDAFFSCSSLTSVTISDSVTRIESGVFWGCSGLTSVTIPDSVTTIEQTAFGDCSNLTSIIIPDSVAIIESEAFAECSRLKDIYYGGSEAQWAQVNIGDGNETLLNANIHYTDTSEVDVNTDYTDIPETDDDTDYTDIPETDGGLTTPVFPDVDGYAEYAEAVAYVSEAGIMVGDENGNFNPNKTVTRAEMATIICRMLRETENLPVSSAFSDVPANHWANTYIGKAAELGIVNGIGNGMFGPSDTVTYEQALTMIVREMALEEEATQAGGYPDGYIEVARERGYIDQLSAEKGDLLARWQIAIILYNACFNFL